MMYAPFAYVGNRMCVIQYIQVTIIAVEPHITRQGFFTIFCINI